MRILYDHQIFYAQKFGGISRYFTEIIQQLELDTDIKIKMPRIFSDNAYIHDTIIQNELQKCGLQKLITAVTKTVYSKKKYNRYVKRKSQKEVIQELKRQSFDLFHPTYYNPYFLDHIGKKPFVITIHDMIHEKFPDFFPQTDKVVHHKKLLAEKAAKIIAISENTKRDIVELLRINEKKIEVIYHGASFQSDIKPKSPTIDLPKRYLLFVGARGIYKNFLFFLSAISALLQKENIHLLAVGGGAFVSEELSEINRLGLSDFVHQLDTSDEELAYLYQNASAFCFPSLYEGFGLPILEAFSHAVPVVLSNTSCFPEIAGNAGLYFNPKDANSIHKTVISVLDSDVKQNLLNNVHERLKHFNWEDSAKKHLNVYKELVQP